jgi:hypothetical protein
MVITKFKLLWEINKTLCDTIQKWETRDSIWHCTQWTSANWETHCSNTLLLCVVNTCRSVLSLTWIKKNGVSNEVPISSFSQVDCFKFSRLWETLPVYSRREMVHLLLSCSDVCVWQLDCGVNVKVEQLLWEPGSDNTDSRRYSNASTTVCYMYVMLYDVS